MIDRKGKPNNSGNRGEWQWSLADNGWADWTCSLCGYTKNTDIHVGLTYRFCPHCGAYMGEHKERGLYRGIPQ